MQHKPLQSNSLQHNYALADYMLEKNNYKLDNIPGGFGLPLAGETPQFLYDAFKVADRHYKAYGPLSRLNLFGQKGVLALGPDLAQQVFLDTNRDFSSKMGFQDRVGLFYNDSLVMIDFDHHKHQRRLMQGAFKNEAMRGYGDRINFIYQRALGEWQQQDHGDFFKMIKNLLLEVAADIFIGVQDRGAQMEKINQAFVEMSNGLMYIFPLNIPGTVYNKGLRGKATLRNFIQNLAPARRAGNGNDMLSHFCREKNEMGEFFTDEEIINQMSFLLFAAHDTTTAALTHTIFYLARHPEVKQKLYEECVAFGKDHLDYDDIDALPYMQMVFYEVQRLRPSVPVLPRRTVREVVMAGHKVPAHTLVFLYPRYSHHMPEYWTNPEEFDPERFSPERNEHKKHPFQFHPFGGGAHKCIGMHFSQMEYKCFLHMFMLQFDFESAAKKDPYMQSFPLPKPADDMPIRFKPRG